MPISDERFMGMIKFLSDQENVRVANFPPEGASWADVADQIVPELSEKQQVMVEMGVWEAFLDRAQSDAPPRLVVAEIFLRGVEFGRELERRTR